MAPRRLLTRLALAAAATLVVLPLTACEPPASVTFQGRGWGHGRGMSQWGALGYAVDHGWSGTRILDHYYGGTTTRTVTATDQRVYLTASRGRELVVTQSAGRLRVDGYGADVRATRVARLSAGRFRVWRGTGCNGPWTLVGDRSAGEVVVRSSIAQGDDPTRMLQHCTGSGTRYYRGELRAVEALGTVVTVNKVATELMLRSIVPKEVSPYWADLGGGRGAAAVRAQAVAARSYAVSGDTRWGSWATTCDSSQCQVYGGYGTRTASGSTITKVEDPRTTTAVAATANQVRRRADGRVARTEFGSSSGGWTAGGDFPAVRDEGDDYAGNANHAWSVTLGRATIEAAYDRHQGRDLGTFQSFDSYARNGLGELGGRVTRVRARFSGGDVTLTGEQVRSVLGLKSNWFATA
ncbi:MAG TPA: SpoIID/LytB domain-containing protein [Acidimicrobiales bacterium]|nr:SpoIID/LytB domain-containing protein [Acidimicrobiales bacterium]